MSNLLIVLLVVGWAAVLAPIALQRLSRRPSSGIDDVARGLARLQAADRGPFIGVAQSGGSARQIRAGARERRSRKRRRDVFTGLLVTTVSSLVVSFVPALAAVRMVAFVSALFLVGYTALLVSVRRSPAPSLALVPADEAPWAYAYER